MKGLPMTMLDDAAITACEHGTFLLTLAATIRIVLEARRMNAFDEREIAFEIEKLHRSLATSDDGALDDIAEAFVAAHRERMRAL